MPSKQDNGRNDGHKGAPSPKDADHPVVAETSMTRLERLSVRATEWVGSIPSLVFHTVFFVGIFSLHTLGFSTESILLILTTIVSLEAIYLAIFIQMTVNRQAADIEEVQEDIEDIQEDVEEISEDVEEISQDIEGIQGEVKELSEDVDEISEDIEEDDREDEQAHRATTAKLDQIEAALHRLLEDIGHMREKK